MLNRHQDRLLKFQGFLQQDPENIGLLAEVADLGIELGDYVVARRAIDQAFRLQPGDPFFLLRRSSVALGEGNANEAFECTSGLLDQGVIDHAIYFNHALALIGLDRFAEAKPFLVKLYADLAPYPLVIQYLLRTYHFLGEVEEGITVALEYIESHPDDGVVMGMLSLLYFDAGNVEQAQVWSVRALAQTPGNLDALIAGGGASLAVEDLMAARDLLNRAVDVQPLSGRAYASLALVDMLDFDLDGAREKLVLAVKYMPRHIGTWITLGWVYLMQNNLDDAEESFGCALAIDDAFGESHGCLGVVAALRGDWVRAERLGRIARRIDPGAMSPNYLQILRLQRAGKGDVVLNVMQDVLIRTSAPGGGSLMDMLGRLSKRSSK